MNNVGSVGNKRTRLARTIGAVMYTNYYLIGSCDAD